MITETSIEIEAPAAVVWDVYAAVEGWPTWTESVTEVEALDAPDLAVGRRYAITQPKFPRLVWEVTELDPGRSWLWRQSSPGGTTLAHHRVEAIGDSRARVTQGVDQRGPVGVVVGVTVPVGVTAGVIVARVDVTVTGGVRVVWGVAVATPTTVASGTTDTGTGLEPTGIGVAVGNSTGGGT